MTFLIFFVLFLCTECGLKGGNEPLVIRQALRELQNDENLNELGLAEKS
ncbi:MAG: hypothetical protein KA717_08175 [Woronichinia naegeliana WA131]|uniref:Uncharacterized protein n=1 Tax=Woronichinia naegeliana WA131 TaxID=2824559 RepID=A0A977PX31_9CYAN|nr:MAG: hypothetical protein KA717_08175 [Woronichinia naegeliana WA131]